MYCIALGYIVVVVGISVHWAVNKPGLINKQTEAELTHKKYDTNKLKKSEELLRFSTHVSI